MNPFPHSVPVMTCAEAKVFEKEFFARGTMSEESAMKTAGALVGRGILRECGKEKISHVLVLAGNGHNAGDAVRAAATIFSQTNCHVFIVFFADDENSLAPLTRKFLDEFSAVVPDEKRKIIFLSKKNSAAVPDAIFSFVAAPHAVLIDGIFGYGFRPPFPPETKNVVEKIFAARSRDSICVAVDLPSGLCDAGADFVVRADLTFPTGIVKRPLVALPETAGRIVPVDLAFGLDAASAAAIFDEEFFLKRIFSPRATVCDKRDFGHVLIVGGSRAMPGALMLNALAALRAGAGLVSVVCPESVQPAFAARAPGAMWIPCRENSDGGLDCATAFSEVQKNLSRATAVLCGSGMGTSNDSQNLIRKIAASVPLETPLVLDADALRAETLDALKTRGAPSSKTILLPHAGEFARLGGNACALREFCREHAATVTLKGSFTRVAGASAEFFTFSGTPALARGGSGDVLAGMTVALFASPKNFSPECSAEERLVAAVVWHGNAARRLAAAQTERCADIASLPNFLSVCV